MVQIGGWPPWPRPGHSLVLTGLVLIDDVVMHIRGAGKETDSVVASDAGVDGGVVRLEGRG